MSETNMLHDPRTVLESHGCGSRKRDFSKQPESRIDRPLSFTATYSQRVARGLLRQTAPAKILEFAVEILWRGSHERYTRDEERLLLFVWHDTGFYQQLKQR